MSSNSLKTAWKYKTEPKDIFDDKFLNEKDLALQPINFLLDAEIIVDNKNLSLDNKKERSKKKSLKESDLYDSNIIIIQELSYDESEPTSINQIEKEVEKINKLILRKSKKNKKNLSKSKKKSSSAKNLI